MSAPTVLVTGGSRGIGRAVVELLASEGVQVAFTWRSDEAAAHEVEAAAGGRATAFQLDLADRKRPAALVAEVEARLGPLEGLVNNAGVQRGALLALTSDAAWDEVLDVNLGGAFRCCRAVLKGMASRRRGAIVNVGSLVALRGVAGLSSYAASKAGLLALTRCLAREMGKRGVRVNAVVPGFVATDMTASLPANAVAGLRAGECLPAGADATAVARAVSFLLSDHAAAITGQSLVVDAGVSA
jgi:3-oxoacyl-[acyl-carrier protein] reductase